MKKISLDCPFHKPCYWNRNECTTLRDTHWLTVKGYEDCPFRKTADEVQALKKKYPYCSKYPLSHKAN